MHGKNVGNNLTENCIAYILVMQGSLLHKHMKFRILYLSALSILLSFFSAGFSLFSIAVGATIGGNYGCIEYNGLRGYESCSLLFGAAGLCIALIVSTLIVIKSYKNVKQYEYPGAD